LELLLVFSAAIQAGEMYEGGSTLKLLIGNTLEVNYINAGECRVTSFMNIIVKMVNFSKSARKNS
jgi:hypothetical protein